MSREQKLAEFIASADKNNPEVAKRIEAGEQVMPPGVLKSYPKPKGLVTQDCVQPTGV